MKNFSEYQISTGLFTSMTFSGEDPPDPREGHSWVEGRHNYMEAKVEAEGGIAVVVPFQREPDPLTSEQIRQEFTKKIQQRLDHFASSRNYDDIKSACSYANDPNPKFASEAAYCILKRSETWTKGYEIMNDVQNNVRAAPTWKELEAELPPLVWPI